MKTSIFAAGSGDVSVTCHIYQSETLSVEKKDPVVLSLWALEVEGLSKSIRTGAIPSMFSIPGSLLIMSPHL